MAKLITLNELLNSFDYKKSKHEKCFDEHLYLSTSVSQVLNFICSGMPIQQLAYTIQDRKPVFVFGYELIRGLYECLIDTDKRRFYPAYYNVENGTFSNEIYNLSCLELSFPAYYFFETREILEASNKVKNLHKTHFISENDCKEYALKIGNINTALYNATFAAYELKRGFDVNLFRQSMNLCSTHQIISIK